MVFRKDDKIRSAFNKVRDEFEEHLDCINANTTEILENRAMIMELQERLCKLSDQLTQVHMMIEEAEPDGMYGRQAHLSLREQEIFLVLYTASDLITYERIASTASLPVALVEQIVDSCIEKGVPIRRHRNERGRIFLSLDPVFKDKQAKQNILGIDESVSKQLSKDFQISLFDT